MNPRKERILKMWHIAVMHRNRLQMAICLRDAAKYCYLTGEVEKAIQLIYSAIKLIPDHINLHNLMQQDLIEYEKFSYDAGIYHQKQQYYGNQQVDLIEIHALLESE